MTLRMRLPAVSTCCLDVAREVAPSQWAVVHVGPCGKIYSAPQLHLVPAVCVLRNHSQRKHGDDAHMALRPVRVAGWLGLSASPILFYMARDSDLIQGGPKALLGTVVCLVVAQNKDMVLSFAQRIVDAPLRLVSRLAGGLDGDGDDGAGDELPPLVPLVRSASPAPHDGDRVRWTSDAHPRFDDDPSSACAYISCRHDLDVCARQPPPSTRRAWDDALGSVPLESLERWRAAAAERKGSDQSPGTRSPLPPPRTSPL